MSVVIAKALNSTLGTSDFKGFDELLYDVLKKIHMESKTLYYSGSEVLTGIPTEMGEFKSSDGFEVTTLHQPLLSFTLPHSGTVGLTYSKGFSAKSDSKYLRLEIFKNGVLYTSASTSTAIDTENVDTFRISGEAGDLIEVKVSVTNKETGATSTATNANVYLYNICATVKDVRPVLFS